MKEKFALLSTVIFALVCSTGCIKIDHPYVPEQESVMFTGACSTVVLGTVPSYVNIEFDDSAFYFFDREHSKVSRIDKNSGALKSRNIQTPEYLRTLCMSGEYLYVYGWSSDCRSVYRIDKYLTGTPELLVTLDRDIITMEAGGNRLYYIGFRPLNAVETSHERELYVYDIQLNTIGTMNDNTLWFDTDGDNVYWISIDTITNERILWKMPHNGATPTVLIKGRLWDYKLMDNYVYAWDDDGHLLRVSKRDGSMEQVLSSPVGFDGDNGYVIMEGIVYKTNCWPLGILSGMQMSNPQRGFVTIDTKGKFDEDDMNCWLWTDKKALYWVAGPDTETSISDEQWGTLFKTYVKKERIFQ